MAEFVFKRGTEILTFNEWKDSLYDLSFDHVIKFIPDVPADPHTDEEHVEMAQWNTRLKKLMEIENGRSN